MFQGTSNPENREWKRTTPPRLPVRLTSTVRSKVAGRVAPNAALLRRGPADYLYRRAATEGGGAAHPTKKTRRSAVARSAAA